jgi:hypothetical protein
MNRHIERVSTIYTSSTVEIVSSPFGEVRGMVIVHGFAC